MGLINQETHGTLKENLESILREIKEDKKLQKQIDDLLSSQHNIPRGTLNEAIINIDSIDTFESVELAAFVSTLNQILNRAEIKPSNYFSATDLKKAAKYKKNRNEFEYPYTIYGVLKASDTEYVAVFSAKEIALLWNSGALTYNFQTQRLSKKRKKADGTVTEKPDVKIASVKKITQLMLKGEYKSNSLLFNILVDGDDNIEYDDGELTIHEGTNINLIDGMHRVQAMLNAIEQDPDYDYNFVVVIRHLPLTEAQSLLSQVNTTNRFDKTHAKYLGSESISSQIAKELMKIPELKDRVSIKTMPDKKLNQLTNFAILSESIELSFDPATNKDRYDTIDVLKKFFGYLINHYEKYFVTEVNETSDISWINHHNTFTGYVALAKKLYDKYGKDFPVDAIVKAIDSVDFAKKEGLPYNDVIAPQGKVGSDRIKRDIREFFENIEV
jgi:hypothetical protein